MWSPGNVRKRDAWPNARICREEKPFSECRGFRNGHTDIRRAPTKALLLWEKGRTDLKANFWHLPKWAIKVVFWRRVVARSTLFGDALLWQEKSISHQGIYFFDVRIKVIYQMNYKLYKHIVKQCRKWYISESKSKGIEERFVHFP